MTTPAATLGLGFLTLGGFIGGVMFWGAFNTALELTNTEKFCTSCHEMHDNVYQELTRTIHFSNRSGVRATCPDCHVPHEWTDKIARKMQASKEVWGKIFGTINTRSKFLEHRLELAQHEWARMKANDSLECRNCHSSVAMDLQKQTQRAAEIHTRYLLPGRQRASIATRALRMSCPTWKALIRAGRCRRSWRARRSPAARPSTISGALWPNFMPRHSEAVSKRDLHCLLLAQSNHHRRDYSPSEVNRYFRSLQAGWQAILEDDVQVSSVSVCEPAIRVQCHADPSPLLDRVMPAECSPDR